MSKPIFSLSVRLRGLEELLRLSGHDAWAKLAKEYAEEAAVLEMALRAMVPLGEVLAIIREYTCHYGDYVPQTEPELAAEKILHRIQKEFGDTKEADRETAELANQDAKEAE